MLCADLLAAPATVSVNEGEIHAVHTGYRPVRASRSRGLLQGWILVTKRASASRPRQVGRPPLPVSLRCKSLCIVNTSQSSTTSTKSSNYNPSVHGRRIALCIVQGVRALVLSFSTTSIHSFSEYVPRALYMDYKKYLPPWSISCFCFSVHKQHGTTVD